MIAIEDFRAQYRVDELAIYDTGIWTWSVRPLQTTIGAGVLSLNRSCGSLAEMTTVEATALPEVASTIEGRLRAVFSAEKFNYVALMMMTPHVHMHVLPRYAGSRTFAGHEWLAAAWPRSPALTWQLGDATDRDVLYAVRDALSEPPESTRQLDPAPSHSDEAT